MACFKADAEVLAFRLYAISDFAGAISYGASFPTPPVPQDAVHALFAAADTSVHNEERPQKRRKFDANSHYATLPSHSQVDQSVVLAKVSVDMVGLHTVLRSVPNS
jgi:hypothetical protein